MGFLGIFPQGEFHGSGGTHHHPINDRARGFEQNGLPADGVGGAGPGVDAGNPRPAGLLKVRIQRVHAVQCAQVRGAGGGGLVQVILRAAAAVKAQVAVGVDKAGEDMAPGRVDEAAGGGVLRQGGHGAHLADAAALDQDKAVGDDAVFHGVDYAVDNEHGLFLPRQGSTGFCPPVWYAVGAAQPRHGSVPCGHSILPRNYPWALSPMEKEPFFCGSGIAAPL